MRKFYICNFHNFALQLIAYNTEFFLGMINDNIYIRK